MSVAPSPLHMFPHSCQPVADLLATRQTILTCQDVANKSTMATSRCNGILEMTRHNRHSGLLPVPTCYSETGVMDFGIINGKGQTLVIVHSS